MKAVVLTDQYDDVLVKKDLYNDIAQYGVEPIEFRSLDDLDNNFNELDTTKPHLFYPSIYMRYVNLPEIIKLHSTNDFGFMQIGQYVVSFIPRSGVTRDSAGDFVPGGTPSNTNFFTFPSHLGLIKLVKPNVPIPRIILYTHNRDVYLRLTLNSLMWSLVDCPEIPVTIVASQPTAALLAVASEFQNRYPQIDVLKVEENAGFAGLNVGIQWHSPEITISAEDDFLLPQAARQLYPLWPYQFAAKLSGVDRIGWGVELQNLSYCNVLDWEDLQSKTRLGWHYCHFKNNKRRPVLMSQLSAFKTTLWQKSFSPELKTALDCSIDGNSKFVAIPFLKGYHIGWNQCQDGIDNYEKWVKTARYPPDKVHVTSLRTNESRLITLSEAPQLSIKRNYVGD